LNKGQIFIGTSNRNICVHKGDATGTVWAMGPWAHGSACLGGEGLAHCLPSQAQAPLRCLDNHIPAPYQ